MQINIVKGVRKVKLLKRELDALTNAKALCAELSTVTTHEVAEAFSVAAESITAGLAELIVDSHKETVG